MAAIDNIPTKSNAQAMTNPSTQLSADEVNTIVNAIIANRDGLATVPTQITTATNNCILSISNGVAGTETITVSYTLKGGGSGTFTLPAATSSSAGLLTAALLTQINSDSATLASLSTAVSRNTGEIEALQNDVIAMGEDIEEINEALENIDLSTDSVTEDGTTQRAINTELRKGVKDIQPLYGDSDSIILEAERINTGTFTVSIPSATSQAAGAMSAEQAALLADLSDRVDALEAGKASFSLSASPSSMWYGDTQNITLTALASVTASSITIKKGSTTLNTGSNVASLSYTDNGVSTSQSYSATAVIKGTTKTASASVTVNYPKYIGAGMAYTDVTIQANRVSTVTGRHTVEITQSGQRIFIVTDVTINKVMSDNFEVPMTRTTTTMNGKTYYIYQSDTLVPYTFNLVIS